MNRQKQISTYIAEYAAEKIIEFDAVCSAIGMPTYSAMVELSSTVPPMVTMMRDKIKETSVYLTERGALLIAIKDFLEADENFDCQFSDDGNTIIDNQNSKAQFEKKLRQLLDSIEDWRSINREDAAVNYNAQRAAQPLT